MSSKLPRDNASTISLSAVWDGESARPLGQKSYGGIGQINALIGHALLDFLSFAYQTDKVHCQYGLIGRRPFEGAQGIQLTSTIGALNPIMGRNLEIFLKMVAEDEEARARDIHIFRDTDHEQDKRLIVYSDPLVMLEYVRDLYVREGIVCDFTRQYSQTAQALTPRNDAGAFYLN